MTKKFISNSLSGTLLYVANVLAAFVMSPIIVSTLRNRDYGIWEIIAGVVGYMGLLDLGMGPALVRNIAVSDANNDELMVKKVISSAFCFFLIIGFVAFILLAIFSHYPKIIFGVDALEINSLQNVIFIVGVHLLVKFPSAVFIGVLMGLQRHYFINNVRLIILLIQTITVYFLFTKCNVNGLFTLAIIDLASALVQCVLFVTLFCISDELPMPSKKYISFTTLCELVRFGIKNSILMLSSRLQKQSIPIIIGRVIGLQNVIFFTMPNKLIEYALGFSMAMGFPLMPYFSALSQSDNISTKQSKWKKTSFLLQIVTLAMPVMLSFLGKPFLSIWIGSEYAEKGSVVLQFLILGMVVEAISPNAGRLIIGANKHGFTAKIWLIISILFVPCSIIGAHLYGIEGVALVSSITSSIGSFVMLYFACHEIEISIIEHIKATVIPLLIPLIILAMSLWVYFIICPPLTYLVIISGSVLSILFYLISIFIVSKTGFFNVITS